MLSRIILIAALTAQSLSAAEAVDSKRAANTVVLDETGVANLKLETEAVEEGEFEESVFALGRIEIIPARRFGVSSRAEGRLTELKFTLGDAVTADAVVAKFEGRLYAKDPPILPLTAPAAGTVTKVNVAVGEPIEPTTTLLEITDFSQVYAVARVPEHEAGRMKPGTAARIKVAALPGEKFEGELLRFGTEADRESGTIDAVFVLPNPNLTLRPGMRSEFAIITETREGVMSIPRAALQGDAVNRYVYVKDFGLKNAFIKTPVVIGKVTDSRVEVISGLLNADEVVVRGAYSLAFAGGGSVSLKEALDAAHGHEHNADGSELTAEQKAAKGAAKGEAGHGHAEEQGGDMLWKVLCGVLALVVVGQALKGRKKTDAAEAKPAVSPKPEEA